MTHQKPIDCRSCEFVSLANAARIAGREPGWASDLVTAGVLEARRLPSGGPPVVTVESLARFLDDAHPVERSMIRKSDEPPLRLVICNA